MKDAKTYTARIKKLLNTARFKAAKFTPPDVDDMPRIVIESILLSEATDRQVAKAMKAIESEFVDFNELRVCQIKELRECFGDNHPAAGDKARVISTALNGIFGRTSAVSLEYLCDMSKRDIRRHLREIGLCTFSEARVSMMCFGIHAVAVDPALYEILQMNDLVGPDATIEETQSLLERLIVQKHDQASIAFFQKYVAGYLKALTKNRKLDAERAAAEQAAAEEAARKAAEEAARRAQEAEEKKKKKAEAKAEAEKKKTAAKKKAKAKKKAQAKAKKKVVKKKPAAKKTAVKKKSVSKKASVKKTSSKKKNVKKASKSKKK